MIRLHQASIRLDVLRDALLMMLVCGVVLLFNPRGPELGYQPFKFGFWGIMLLILLTLGWLDASGRKGFAVGLPPAVPRWLGPVLACSAVSLMISSVCSVDRPVSFGGLPETFQGFWIQLAVLVTPLLMFPAMRSPEGCRRLIWALLLAATAAGGFAILQRLGLDPNRPELAGGRCPGPAGHAVYLGGFMVMALPFAVLRVIQGFSQAGNRRWIDGSLAVGMLCTQMGGLYCAESRGPFVALVAGALTALLLVAACSRRMRLLLLGVVATITVVAFGLLAALGGLRETNLADMPVFRRFASIKGMEKGIEFYRSETWRLVPAVMLADPPVPIPSGGHDGLSGWRLPVGYGPETLPSVLPAFRAWHATSRQENRLHNLIWDRLQSQGLLGVSCLLVFWLLLVLCLIRRLGLAGNRPGLAIGAGMAVVGGVLGAILAGWCVHIGFVAVGGMLGSAAGIVGAACFLGFRGRSGCRENQPAGFDLMIACAASLAAHWVDMATSFPTGPTALAFALVAAMVLAGGSDKPEPDNRPAENKSETAIQTALLAFAGGAILCSCIHQYSYEPMSIGEILRLSLWNGATGAEPASRMALLPVIVLIGFGFLSSDARSQRTGWRLFLPTVAALAFTLAHALFQAEAIRSIGPLPQSSDPDEAALSQAYGYVALWSVPVALAVVLAMAASWQRAVAGGTDARIMDRFVRLGGAVVVLCVSMIAAWKAVMLPIAANVVSQWGDSLVKLERHSCALPVLRLAVFLDPGTFAYRGLLGNSLLHDAAMVPDPAESDRLVDEAVRIWTDPGFVSDLNRRHFFLGQALIVKDMTCGNVPGQATAALSRALRHEPYQEEVWTYASIASRLLDKDDEQADRLLARALELAKGFPDVAGRRYTEQAGFERVPALRAELARIASIHHQRVVASGPGPLAARSLIDMARMILSTEGAADEAAALLKSAADMNQPETKWQAHALLAELDANTGDVAGAVEHLRKALETAPAGKRDRIRDILRSLGAAD